MKPSIIMLPLIACVLSACSGETLPQATERLVNAQVLLSKPYESGTVVVSSRIEKTDLWKVVYTTETRGPDTVLAGRQYSVGELISICGIDVPRFIGMQLASVPCTQ